MRKQRWLIGVLVWVMGVVTPTPVLARSESDGIASHIYRIRVGQCRYAPYERQLVGFRVRDSKLIGIVTALHGVADCTSITAEATPQGPGSFTNLEIVKVDIERDMALLWTGQMDSLTIDGLVPETEFSSTRFQGVMVWGYPAGVNGLQRTPLTVQNRDTLNNLITPEITNYLKKRKSPTPQIEVLKLSGGHLAPGDSGAPLINANQRLVGVGNGGLDQGRIEIAWAIPWEDIQWKSVSESTGEALSSNDLKHLNELGGMEPTQFAFITSEDVDESLPVESLNREPVTEALDPITLNLESPIFQELFDGMLRNGEFTGEFPVSSAPSAPTMPGFSPRENVVEIATNPQERLDHRRFEELLYRTESLLLAVDKSEVMDSEAREELLILMHNIAVIRGEGEETGCIPLSIPLLVQAFQRVRNSQNDEAFSHEIAPYEQMFCAL